MTENATSIPTSASEFREGLARHTLRYQRCDSCGQAQTLRRYLCTQCGAATLHWHTASGQGTVRAHSTVHRAPTEEFKPLVPYTLVLVELEEGPRVMGHAHPSTAIGSRVEAHYFAHHGVTLLSFEPLAASADT